MRGRAGREIGHGALGGTLASRPMTPTIRPSLYARVVSDIPGIERSTPLPAFAAPAGAHGRWVPLASAVAAWQWVCAKEQQYAILSDIAGPKTTTGYGFKSPDAWSIPRLQMTSKS